VHHGNGTQAGFERDAALFFGSSHQVRVCLCCSLSSFHVRESRLLAAALSTAPLSRARPPRCAPPPPRTHSTRAIRARAPRRRLERSATS
jgi:hypothetical protein